MELLVVIGIIALLIGILLPVLSKARAQANRTVCLSNIKQLGTAILMYCNDNKGYFPTCAEAAIGLSTVQMPEDWIWWQANRDINDSAIARYVGRGEKLKTLLLCPSDDPASHGAKPGIAHGQGPYLYSYSMNVGLATNRWEGAYCTKITRWRAPARKIMLTERWEKSPTAGWGYTARLTERHGTQRFHKDIPGFPEMTRGGKVGANVSAVFLDGHASGIDQDFAYDPFHERIDAQ